MKRKTISNQEALECFRTIRTHATFMETHIEDYINGRKDKMNDVYLAEFMGQLHNNLEKVEDWLFNIMTTTKEHQT